MDPRSNPEYKPSLYVDYFTTMTIPFSSADFRRDAFDSIVLITVGHQNQLFYMHKKLLCDTSGFFRAALNGRFQESRNQAIEMPEDDVEVFRYFQYWAYTGVLDQKPLDLIEIPWHTLAGIYVFAEARCIPALQNVAMDLFISKHESSPRAPIEEYRYIYENTAELSPVRRFLAEWAAHRGSLSRDWFQDRTIYPVDFAIDLSLALYNRIQKNSTYSNGGFWEARSKYHVDVTVAQSGEGRSERI